MGNVLNKSVSWLAIILGLIAIILIILKVLNVI